MKETNYQQKNKEDYDGSYESLTHYKIMPKEKGELEEMLNSKSMKGGKC
jgi:hypothetical protein